MRDPSERDAHAAHGRSRPSPMPNRCARPRRAMRKTLRFVASPVCFGVFLCEAASRVFPPAKDLLLALSGSDVRGRALSKVHPTPSLTGVGLSTCAGRRTGGADNSLSSG